MDDKEQQTITLITHQKEILRSSKLRHLPVLTLRCRLSVGKCNCFLVSHWGQNYILLNSINSRATILLHILTFYDTTCRWKLVSHSNRRESVDWSLPVWSRTLFLQTCSLRCASQLSYLQTARPRAQYSYRYCNSGGDSIRHQLTCHEPARRRDVTHCYAWCAAAISWPTMLTADSSIK